MKQPVFIDSPTPESGADTAQRCLCALPRVRIYGETSFDAAFVRLVDPLFETFISFARAFEGPTKGINRLISEGKDISGEPLSAFTPSIDQFKAGMKLMIETTFAHADVWGFVSTGSAAHVQMLRVLFHDALFVVTIRNPKEAFESWRGYSSEKQACAVIQRSRDAYGSMFAADGKGEGRVLWIDWEEAKDKRLYLVKLFKFLGREIPRSAWSVFDKPMREYKETQKPVLPAFAIGHAGHELAEVYSVALRYAKAQAPREL